MNKRLVKFQKNIGSMLQVDRDPRYVFMLVVSIPILLLTTLQALNKGWFDSFERPMFNAINQLPHFFHYPFLIITQFGSLGSLIFWMGLGYFLVNRRASLMVLASGFTAWFFAKVLKVSVHRGRPADLLHSVNSFHTHFSGYGFPSGHATFSAACATALYYQVSPKYRKYLLWLVLLVGLSRMYLGAHFPLDVVGGWALGVSIASAISLIFGNSRNGVRASFIRRILKRRDYELETVKFLQLDARGSRPIYIKDKDGKEYFAKLFGSQEYAADLLFKLYRLFRYKNLQAEEPYLNSRRNVEIESLANLWAKKGGVRVPEIIDLIKAGKYWLLVQEKVDAKPLTDIKRISTKALVDSWRQVQKLHNIPMAHRDLRAANLMIDSKDQSWLIDFGFAETSPNRRRMLMDNAELLMSMSLVVGVKRTVESAYQVLEDRELKATLPYLQRSVFSGATRQALRKDKQLLNELTEAIKQKIDYSGEVDEANIDRLNSVKLFNFAIVGIFIYLILPQFKQFKAAFVSIHNLSLAWLLGVAIFSLLTYISAGLIYYILSDVPIKLRQSIVVQLAASFMTKILPGGLGGTGLTTRYLIKSGMDNAGAAAIVLIQGLIGFAMFLIPTAFFVLFSGNRINHNFHLHLYTKWIVAAGVIVLASLILLYFVDKLRQKAIKFFAQTITQIKDSSPSLSQLVMTAGVSLTVTIFYVACLYASAHAIHIHLSIADAILAYIIAIIAKSTIPAPGGLGPLEIAMAASLVSSGLDHGQAIAVVIVYRLATFWIPIPFSVIAFRYAQRAKLI